MKKEIEIKYKNNAITVIWKPNLCIHSTVCWRELNSVFDPKTKKWINVEGAPPDKIKAQINRCPSGALSYL